MKRFLIGLLTVFLITACAGGSPASVQGGWRLVSHGSGSNQTPAAPDVDTTIEFDSEGNLSGNVGCNGFGGEYKVDGNQIEFGPIMSTMMFCEGPVGEQEMAVLSVFLESAAFVMDGNVLTITSANGDSSIVLERK